MKIIELTNDESGKRVAVRAAAITAVQLRPERNNKFVKVVVMLGFKTIAERYDNKEKAVSRYESIFKMMEQSEYRP